MRMWHYETLFHTFTIRAGGWTVSLLPYMGLEREALNKRSRFAGPALMTDTLQL